ncbi:hypothetical protein MRX96_037657 [Rhipicephalus microplus]
MRRRLAITVSPQAGSRNGLGSSESGGEGCRTSFVLGATTTTAQEQVREGCLDRQRGSVERALTAAGLQWLRRASVVAETATRSKRGPLSLSTQLSPQPARAGEVTYWNNAT